MNQPTPKNHLNLAPSADPYVGLTVRVVKFLPHDNPKQRFSLLLVEVLDLLPKQTKLAIQETLMPLDKLPDTPRVRVERDAKLQYRLEYLNGKRWKPVALLSGIQEFERAGGPKEYVLDRIDSNTAILGRRNTLA